HSCPACCCYSPALAVIPTLSLHDALPIWGGSLGGDVGGGHGSDGRACGVCVRPTIPMTGTLTARWGVPRGVPAHSPPIPVIGIRSEEHTSELQSRFDLVCRLLLEKNNKAR